MKFIKGLVAACVVFATMHASAELPKTIKVILPYQPGSIADIQYRDLEMFLATRGIVTFPVYKPGASSVVASQELDRSKKDGSVLMINITSNAYHATKTMGQKSIDPITTTGGTALVFVTKTGSNYESYDGFKDAWQAKDRRLSIGWFTVSHLLAISKLEENYNEVRPLMIPYKTSGDVARDIVAGSLAAGIMPYSTARPLVEAGKLSVIFGYSPGNERVLPVNVLNIRTKIPAWQQKEVFFIGVPPGTSKKMKAEWSALLSEYLNMPATKATYAKSYFSRVIEGPEFINNAIDSAGAEYKKFNIEVR